MKKGGKGRSRTGSYASRHTADQELFTTKVDSKFYILQNALNRLFELNDTGERIFLLSKKGLSADQIAEKLQKEFGIPQKDMNAVVKDTREFLKSLDKFRLRSK